MQESANCRSPSQFRRISLFLQNDRPSPKPTTATSSIITVSTSPTFYSLNVDVSTPSGQSRRQNSEAHIKKNSGTPGVGGGGGVRTGRPAWASQTAARRHQSAPKLLHLSSHATPSPCFISVARYACPHKRLATISSARPPSLPRPPILKSPVFPIGTSTPNPPSSPRESENFSRLLEPAAPHRCCIPR